MKYNPSLDGLRTVAVMLVLLLHTVHRLAVPTGGTNYFIYSSLRFGWIGVDIFFVLSGFLITGILLSQRHVERREYFTVFYARRSLRIFPLYFSFVLVVLTLLKVYGHLGTLVDWAAVLTYLQNFVWILKSTNIAEWLGHTWSLAVEEHFYFLWPMMVYFVPIRRLKIGIPIAVAAILVLRFVLVGFNLKRAVLISTPTRCDTLLIGALLALICHVKGGEFKLPDRAAAIIRVLAAASLAVVLLAGIYARDLYDESAFNRSVGFLLVALFSMGLVAECLREGLFHRFLSNRPMVGVGKITYGMYLFHLPIFTLLGGYMARWNASWPYLLQVLALFAAGSTLTVLISAVSFNYFESKVLAYKRYFRYSRVAEA